MARRWLGLVAIAIASLCVASPASAYTVRGGDLLLKPVMGASVNVLRLEVATRDTPAGGMLTGVELDYAITGEWAVTAGLRPVLSPGFVDTGLAVGGKYRLIATDAPLIPYASAALTTALGVPLQYGDAHLNMGLRAGIGADYFVLRDLAVGIEFAGEGSLLAVPLATFEVTPEALLGVTWRF
jgi:hypothetical protein